VRFPMDARVVDGYDEKEGPAPVDAAELPV
jgi:hypothetical protein